MCGCKETTGPSAPGTTAVAAAVPPVVDPTVPLATPVPTGEAEGDPTAPDQPPLPLPLPGFTFCGTVLREGCYALTFHPTATPLQLFEGTLRVDRSAPDGGPDNIIVSGDLYRRRLIVFPPFPPFPPIPPIPAVPEPAIGAAEAGTVAAVASSPETGAQALDQTDIPIFARSRYHSYLKITQVTAPAIVIRPRPCTVTLVAEQFDYTHPLAGQFKGSFPAAASRTVTLSLTAGPPSPAGGPTLVGRWAEGGVDKGVVTLRWVSRFFRRATVEIDTLTGAVAPQPVGGEFFDTIYAKHGWRLTVVSDQTGISAPPGVDPNACWTSGNLHNLMTGNRNPATNVDTEWRIHLIVVPAKLGCSRGVMYDQIDVPREGCASFSDDGYPTSDSANFGAAANQKQRDIPRAYLRSATHEITHTFNQIHQEQETAADNSIMTTTPSVADVLGGPTTGAPGVFPDQIDLAVNTTVRHHLNHMPDPVIRPGGWPFASWFASPVPQAGDRYDFDPSELDLVLSGPSDRVVLGAPFELTWTMTNRSDRSLVVPNDVTLEGQFAAMTITDGGGIARDFRPFVVACDTVKLAELAPAASVSAGHRVFWSSDGFAFPQPGRYRVAVAVTWSARGIPVRVAGAAEVYVDFPTTVIDNEAAGLMMNAEVGKWVALGGDAYHLTEATRRLTELADAERSRDAADASARVLAGLDGLMPDPERLGAAEPDGDDGGDRPARPRRGRRR